MSYLHTLLNQEKPLETHEQTELRNWLKVLEGDCELFGDTPDDRRKMAAIRAKLNEKT